MRVSLTENHLCGGRKSKRTTKIYPTGDIKRLYCRNHTDDKSSGADAWRYRTSNVACHAVNRTTTSGWCTFKLVTIKVPLIRLYINAMNHCAAREKRRKRHKLSVYHS